MVEVLPHLQANMEVVQHILMEVEEDTNRDINKDINNHMVKVPTMSTIQHMEDTKQDLPFVILAVFSNVYLIIYIHFHFT